MISEKNRNIRLGLFVVAGAFLLIFGLYSLGSNKNLFGKTFKISTVFFDVNGLTEGNNVRYSGIDVGTVDKIEIVNDSAVRVVMLIDESVKKFIRRNSVASVGTDGLMGNKLVNILPGTPDAPLVKENDEINALKAVNTDDMLRTLDLTNNNIATISSNLKEITETVKKSRGTLYSVLMDTMLAKSVSQTLKNIKLVSNNLAETSNQINSIFNDVGQGKGTIGMLLNDTTMPNDMRIAMKNVREGTDKFSKITEDVTQIVDQINSGNGIATGLIRDSLMRNDLTKSLSNLESASKKLDEDLEAMKHSFLLRGYFKDQERKKKQNSK